MNDNESLRLAMLRVLDAVKRRDAAREDLAAAERDLADARRAVDVLMDEPGRARNHIMIIEPWKDGAA